MDPPKFSVPAFATVCAQWADWQNGIPPGRRWAGRGAQNPYLLQAFDAVSRAYDRWQREQTKDAPGAGGSIHDDPDVVKLRGGR